jgi:hypothetical protein
MMRISREKKKRNFGTENIAFLYPMPILFRTHLEQNLERILLYETVIRIPGIFYDIFDKDINHYAGKTKERTDRSQYKQVVRRMKT